jgi:hypothetical protein
MSALGHKQTYAVQNGMSALLLIATAKANFRTRCPLYPQKRTCAVQLEMSALVHPLGPLCSLLVAATEFSLAFRPCVTPQALVLGRFHHGTA